MQKLSKLGELIFKSITTEKMFFSAYTTV